MRILQLTPKMPYPPKDGGAIAAWNLATGLTKAGHEITILAMNTDKHFTEISSMPENIRQMVQWHTVPVFTKINVLAALRNLFFSKLPYTLTRFRNKTFGLSLYGLLQKQTFDIVQLDGLACTLYIPVIRRCSDALIVYRAHNIEWEIWDRKAQKERNILRKMYLHLIAARMKRFEIRLMNQYDLLVPITDRDNRMLEQMGNRKPSCVIYAGVDPAIISSDNTHTNNPSVAYIGALDWMPNQEGLVWFLEEVWDPLSMSHPGICFHIAGRNAPRWLEEKISSCRNVIYEGEVEDAGSFVSAHPVFVAPLFSGSGMRVKIIEAMARGRIVLSTPLGAEGLPVQHKKNILLASSAVDFRKHLEEVLADLKQFIPLGVDATSLVREKFDNFALADQLASFYLKYLK